MDRNVLGRPLRYWWSVLEQFAAAFLVTFLVTWTAPLLNDAANSDVTVFRQMANWDFLQDCAAAGLVAVAMLLKSLLGGLFGNKSTASLLPASKDPATPPPAPPDGQEFSADGGYAPAWLLLVVVLVVLLVLLIWPS